jgi:hypothetical protein
MNERLRENLCTDVYPWWVYMLWVWLLVVHVCYTKVSSEAEGKEIVRLDAAINVAKHYSTIKSQQKIV